MVEARPISDDWTDVDDVASVRSLSSFDDDFGSRPASPLLAPVRPPSAAPSPHPSPPPSPPLYQPPQPDSDLSLTLPLRPASNPFLRSPPSPAEQLPVEQLPDSRPAPATPHHFTYGDPFNWTSTSTANPISTSISTDRAGEDKDGEDNDRDADEHCRDDDARSQINPDDDNKDDKNNDEDEHDQDDNSDPNTYLTALRGGIALIEATAAQALRLGASRISTLSFLKSACDELLKQTQELRPILATYARRWNDGGEREQGDMPLNPSLLEWISHLNGQLLHAQNVMDRIPIDETKDGESTSGLSAKSIPLHLNVSLAGCSETLEDALATIEDFMPIFKTDFDEAQTRRMHIPTEPVGEHKSQPRRDAPHPDVARIRRELYSLKDQLRQMMALLSGLPLGTILTSSTVVNAQTVLQRFEEITEAISTILTNHASEWFESGMRSGSARRTIAYDEFLALDPEVLLGITNHISELYQGLVVDDPEMMATCTAEMIRNHQVVLLIECGQLQELDFVAELLESLVF